MATKSLFFFIAVAACFVLTGCSRIARVASAIQLAAECARLDDLGLYTRALTACGNSIKMAPTYPAPYFYRGFAHLNLGNNAQALADYTNALTVDPTFVEAYTARGGLRLHLKDYRGALDDAATVERLAPDSARGYASECYVLSTMQRYADAGRVCDRAKAAPKDRSLALSTDIDFASRTADWKRAVGDSVAMRAEEPEAAETHNTSCWLEIQVNDFPDAASDCDKALELAHDEPHVRDTRAELFFLQKRYPEALADENSMINRHPYASYGYAGRCAIETETDQLRQARIDCARAVSLDDMNGDWLVLRGNVYRAEGDFADAFNAYRRARAIDPSAFKALREEARLDLDLHRAADAARLAGVYIIKNPFDPIGHDVYGRALAALGEPEAASQLALAESGYHARSDPEGERSARLALARAQAHAHL